MSEPKKHLPTFRLAERSDSAELVRLVNRAYRGESGKKGWTTEAELIEGQRVDAGLIDEIFTDEKSRILVATNADSGEEIFGCVHIKNEGESCYLGMLTVSVDRQKLGIGDFLVSAAERFARESFGCRQMVMTVLSVRRELIAWYEKRGYARTGENKPFPYGDERFGRPLRDDLIFDVLIKDLERNQ